FLFAQSNRRDLQPLHPQINYNRFPHNIDSNNIPRLGLHQLPSICLFTLKATKQPEYGRSGPIDLVEFHPNSNYLASAHNDDTIHLWNIHNQNSLIQLI
ncbi:unnamed protein product, partial [Rotaria sp. Silwood1]